VNILDVAISSINFLSLNEKILLRKNLDSLDILAVMSKEEISSIIRRPIRADFDGRLTEKLAVRGWTLMESQEISGVLYDQKEFPALLREIPNPPYIIYYRGNLGCLEKKCVSVVGTRQIVRETAEATFNFSKTACENGYTVVSGLANGIDSFAHKGALASGQEGCTCAVLPCGIDTIVPVGHKNLVQQILRQNGVYLSEYIPGCPAEAWRFVQRNRIIAALSGVTVVMQAPAGSGALITADFALDYNRELMFHESCFCDEANNVASKRCAALKNGSASKVSKLQNTSERFVSDGAPVISGFEDFVEASKAEPGTYNCKKTKQLTLGLD